MGLERQKRALFLQLGAESLATAAVSVRRVMMELRDRMLAVLSCNSGEVLGLLGWCFLFQ